MKTRTTNGSYSHPQILARPTGDPFWRERVLLAPFVNETTATTALPAKPENLYAYHRSMLRQTRLCEDLLFGALGLCGLAALLLAFLG